MKTVDQNQTLGQGVQSIVIADFKTSLISAWHSVPFNLATENVAWTVLSVQFNLYSWCDSFCLFGLF